MNINAKETVMQFCLWRILLSGDIRNITSSQWSLSVLSEEKRKLEVCWFFRMHRCAIIFVFIDVMGKTCGILYHLFLSLPTSSHCSLSVHPKKISKPLIFFFQRVQKETSGMKWVDWDTLQSLFTKLNIHYKAGPSCTRKIHYYRLFDRTIMQPIKLYNFRMMNRSIESFENFQKQSPGVILWKKMFSNNLQNSQEIHRLQACNFTRKETPTQVFSCEFCEIFRNIFFMEHLRWLLLNLRILNFRLFIFLNMTNWIC